MHYWSPLGCYILRPSHSPWFDRPFNKQYKLRRCSLIFRHLSILSLPLVQVCNFLNSPASPLLDIRIFSSVSTFESTSISPILPCKISQLVNMLSCIRELNVSNSWPDTTYRKRGFSCVSSSNPDRCRKHTMSRNKIAGLKAARIYFDA
jgi:hypothetical protein